MLSHSAVIEGWGDEETLAGLEARKGGSPDVQRALFANELRNSGGDLTQSLAALASLADVPCPLAYVCMNIYYSRVCDPPSEATPEPKGRIDASASYAAVQKVLDSGVHAVLLCEVVFGGAEPGLITQGVPGVPQDPLAPPSGPPGHSPDPLKPTRAS